MNELQFSPVGVIPTKPGLYFSSTINCGTNSDYPLWRIQDCHLREGKESIKNIASLYIWAGPINFIDQRFKMPSTQITSQQSDRIPWWTISVLIFAVVGLISFGFLLGCTYAVAQDNAITTKQFQP